MTSWRICSWSPLSAFTIVGIFAASVSGLLSALPLRKQIVHPLLRLHGLTAGSAEQHAARLVCFEYLETIAPAECPERFQTNQWPLSSRSLQQVARQDLR